MAFSIDLTPPQLEFFQSTAKATAAVAGFGCVAADTLIYTEYGLQRMCDIAPSTKVLSYNEKELEFEYKVSSGAFLKGVGKLYRVAVLGSSTVLRVYDSHRMLGADGEYHFPVDIKGKLLQAKLPIRNELPGQVSVVVEEEEFESPYYDIQVLDNNNYICENGLIHHNSGKTNTAMARMVATMIEYPAANMLYSAPTMPLIRDILYDKLSEFLPEIGIEYSINKAHSIVNLHGLGQIFCRSMDNPDRLVGFEVLDSYLDELDILATAKAVNVYRKCKARCRQKCFKVNPKTGVKERKINQMFVSTTPEGFKATYKLFDKEKARSSHLVRMSTYSNAHNLPDDYIDDLRDNYPAQLIDAYLLGKFVNLVSAPVWSGFSAVSNRVLGIKVQRDDVLHIGQDFNVGRGCAVVKVKRIVPVGHPMNLTKEPWEILAAVDEVYNSYDTPDTIRALQEMYPFDKYPNQIVYPDASGKSRKSTNATTSDIRLMRHAGYQIKRRNKNPNIKDRVAAGNNSFCSASGKRRVYVDTDRCPHYVEGLTQQVYDSNGLPAKGDGMGDDITDAGSYVIYYHFPVHKPGMKVKDLGGA